MMVPRLLLFSVQAAIPAPEQTTKAKDKIPVNAFFIRFSPPYLPYTTIRPMATVASDVPDTNSKRRL